MTLASWTWSLTRAAGLVSWLLLAVSMLWGLLATSRVLERRPSPAWLLTLHRHLGGLTVVLTAIHVAALWADEFVEFGVADLLVPFHSGYDRVGVALGVVALWLLLLVDASARLRRSISPPVWRVLHLLGIPLMAAATAHGLLVGSDTGQAAVVVVGLVVTVELLLVGWLRVRYGRRAAEPTVSTIA